MMLAENRNQTGIPLQTLLEGMTDAPVGHDISVQGICADSREVRPGDLFLACPGTGTRGSLYIRAAVQAGAAAVAVDEALLSDLDRRLAPVITAIPVPALRDKLGLVAARFYGEPTQRLRVTGITGTNGKTSVSWWLAKAHSALAGKPAGLVGTLGYGCFPRLQSGPNTTPGAISLQRLCAGFLDAGADAAYIEVSSHALDQGRVNGVEFDTAVFTNLSRDHLDYHRDLDDYFRAKGKLFAFESLRAAVVNADDDRGRRLLQQLPAGVEPISYGLAARGFAPLVAAAPAPGPGLALDIASPWGSGRVQPGVTGKFNAGNILAVISTLCLAGFSFDRVLEKLENTGPVPGRMESFVRADGARVVVDYAHTPAALEQVLASLGKDCEGRLICVFGCGGDRDREKRPLMGAAAERLAAQVILTDDNPRTESGDDIIADILSGMKDAAAVTVERNRSRAIELALEQARPADVALIAGKGHETAQEIAGKRYPFSDRQQVRALLERAG